jgi:hypothetical protein
MQAQKTVEIGKFTFQLPYLGRLGSAIVHLDESTLVAPSGIGTYVRRGDFRRLYGRPSWVGS